KLSRSAHGSTASATPSSASSTNSNTSEPSQPDTTNATTISSHPYNSRQSESGCEVMSRSPRAVHQRQHQIVNVAAIVHLDTVELAAAAALFVRQRAKLALKRR